jgi:hypothetical protein
MVRLGKRNTNYDSIGSLVTASNARLSVFVSLAVDLLKVDELLSRARFTSL